MRTPSSAALDRRSVNMGVTSTGMTLIEVLVTLVIISVGLLGVAAMQLATVRNNYDAFVRSQAAVLAGDMLDRIRANRALAPTYDLAYGATAPGATVQAVDMNDWKATLEAQLPQGQGEIVSTEVVGSVPRVVMVRVRIRWGERGTTDPVEFTTSSEI